jgi:ankyrin repeat protein
VSQDHRGLTALHLSVATGNLDIVNVLLNRAGANVNIKNNLGRWGIRRSMLPDGLFSNQKSKFG